MEFFKNTHFVRKLNKLYFSTLIVLAVMFLPVTKALSQKSVEKPDLQFQRIFEGLLNNRVSAIFQDSRGYMWIGTYSGLHQYDGLDFKVYGSSADSSSINDNYIGSIYEDSHNQLWVGTGNGVARYNRDMDDFTRFKLPSAILVQGGESNLVNTILEDDQGTLWVSSLTSGLFYFDREQQQLLPYKVDEVVNINAMVAGDGDILWLATLTSGLIKLNTSSGRKEYYQHDPTDPQTISSNNVKAVTLDLEGNLWAGARSKGLNRMVVDQGEVSFVHYLNEAGNPNSLFNNIIFKLYLDRKGNLWACHENGGLHLYNKEKDNFYRYLHDPKDPNSLAHNSIWSIFQDNQDRYWIGTAQSGINLADPYASKFAHYYKNPLNTESLNNDIIRDFSETENGNIWVATDGGGLNYFDRSQGTFRAYRHDPKNPKSLGSDAVISLNEDLDGNLWVGTWAGGLNILLDEEKGIFTSFNEWIKNDTYPIQHVFDVHFDENYIWIAALEEGLYRYDQRAAELKVYKQDENDPNSISSNFPLRIFEDSQDNLWIGTLSGLNLMKAKDKDKGKFKVYQPSNLDPNSIPSNSIRQIVEDRNQNIWIATDRGLSRYMPEGDNFITYTQKDGLPVNEINSIVEDDSGFLWIGTNRGISKFDPVNQEFTNFDKNDGLQGNEFSRYAVLKTRKGELLFGGMNGFNLFHPDHLISNPFIPQVYLTGFKLFNQPVDFKAPDSPLQKHIAATDTLTLSHRENVFTFDFIALNYTHPDQNQYAYILEGFEKEWNYVGSQRNATYTNLNPGTYTFRVKAANSDGLWNEAGTSVVLIVTPPFWKTDWFITLSTLLAIGLLILAYKRRVRSIHEQNRQLENTVEERTTMLKHANGELKKHINEKDKLLSIIGHDLRNPFFSIIGYMELLEEEFENTKNSEHLENIRFLLNVSRNTHNLLENLLQWAIKDTKLFEVKPEVIPMSKLVKTAIGMVSSQADYKNINLDQSGSENAFIHADQKMILTVLRNLISNAIKFSDQNSRIEILVREKSGNVITSVRDHGTGMNETVLSKLFSRSSEQQSGTMGEMGTGLGLVLCQEIVHKHGGKIWAESIPGQGSTFHFSLLSYEHADVAV
ncbi:two-component regulator propeller domain-containing protein [Algoriphagus persicinus]|uniref:two-component regulator propeller domain-containing protein n=1 Tax=Algoriphagus persicinus TaxID=3108754 RepID=UPI002B38F520|nr:two-component regulator propeller domain-containing protein [Algoriphagus sp. E1-3-M2]MEB2784122.1 two-component regulator propeller domain-containing protein [Algoriphagus sp. E1-3-M2]